MTILLGNVAAYRFDQSASKAIVSKVACDKQQPQKPDTWLWVVSVDIYCSADLFIRV